MTYTTKEGWIINLKTICDNCIDKGCSLRELSPKIKYFCSSYKEGE
jgi:hypothetical protein